MKFESLVPGEISTSISLNWKLPEKEGSKRGRSRISTEGERVAAFLSVLGSDRFKGSINLGGVAYRVSTTSSTGGGGSWCQVAPDGACKGVIELASVDNAERIIQLKFSLTREGASGLLSLTYAPTHIFSLKLDSSPALFNEEFPSSAFRTLGSIHILGFDLLRAVHRLWERRFRSLLSKGTRARIDAGDGRIAYIRWETELSSPDVGGFLQLLPAFYANLVIDGKETFQLGERLGLDIRLQANPATHVLNGVTIHKKNGTKRLFTAQFSAPVAKESASPEREASGGSSNSGVRLTITAHPAGIATMGKKARKELTAMHKGRFFPDRKERGWPGELPQGEPPSTASCLQRAAFLLAHRASRGDYERTSLADWLVPEVMNRILRLDVLSSFTSENLGRLERLDDDVAKAWLTECGMGMDWAAQLAEKADCTAETVRNRREKFLGTHKVDISLPPSFYRDLLMLGTSSFASSEDRAAFGRAVDSDDPEEAVEVWRGSLGNFNERRMSISEMTRPGVLRQFEVEPVDATFISHRLEPYRTSTKLGEKSRALAAEPRAQIPLRPHRRRAEPRPRPNHSVTQRKVRPGPA